MTEARNIYISCEKGKEKHFQGRAEAVYQEYACVQDKLGEDTEVLVVICQKGKPVDSAAPECLEYARQRGIQILLVSEHFIPAGAIEKLLWEDA